MGETRQAEADQLSPGQRWTIRRAVQEAIDEHGIEWAMRNTCALLEAKYGISYDTIEYLLHDELPAALPEELLTSSQRNKIRRDFSAATSIADPARSRNAVSDVVKRSAEHFGVSEDTIRAVVGVDGDTVRPTPPPGGSPVSLAAPSLPEPGQVVEVRGSTWAVANVQAQGLPLSPADDAAMKLNHVVDLQSLDEDRLGEQLSVIWELEVGKTVTPPQGLPEHINPEGFDDPVTLAGFIDAMRWNAGAHYTPKSLAREVVLHALQPLCYAPGPYQTGEESQWKLKSSDDLLSLKVADIACGSGAFLVSAASYLADRVVEAWTAEDPANAHRSDLHRRAIREVVANCLYGADINDMAVEMCKLSLWLVSLDRDLPFSFVDDKIFLGNSLLGITSLDQLRKLHIDPSRVPAGEMFDIFNVNIDAIIRKATELRRSLASEVDENNPARNTVAKRRQLAQLLDLTASLRKIADGVVATGLPLGGRPGRALDEAYENLRIAIRAAHPESGTPDSAMLDTLIDEGLKPTVDTDYQRWRPNHWIIETPDVTLERGGFDAVIGNPPFLGGQKLTGALGTEVRDWFVDVLAGGTRGSADQVAYFFLRAQDLLSSHGTLGLIATNTIAQGDTRGVGLDRMVDAGFTITRAIQSRSWPAESANLEYSAVWGTIGPVAKTVLVMSDDEPVKRITPLLEPGGRITGNPFRLAENANIAFQGCIVLGMGFVLEPDVARAWIAEDPRNAEVLSPYLNGEALNSRPDCSEARWVIDFNDRDEDDAARYAIPFARVHDMVRPERVNNKRKVYRDYWWQYAEKRPALRKAIAALEEVLVIAQTSKTLRPVLVRPQVFDQKLVVFANQLDRGPCRPFVECPSGLGHQVRVDDAHRCCVYAFRCL